MKSTGWPFTSTHSGSVKLFTRLTRLRTTSKISAQKLLNLRHRLWSWPMIAGNLEIEVPCTLPAVVIAGFWLSSIKAYGEKADPDYPISAIARAAIAKFLPAALTVGGEARIGVQRLPLLRRVPHQPRVEGLGREHCQDHDSAKGEGAGAGLDRDHRAERDQRAEQRLHENVDHRPAPDETYDVIEPGAVAQPSRAGGLDRDQH